jgi:4-hydroxybenzoate polyprenyltransferase
LGIFDEVIASDGATNMTGATKAARLVKRFGERGFVYAGNSAVDGEVWKRAAAAIVVNGSRSAKKAANDATRVIATYDPPRSAKTAWPRALRPHQWVKNFLVFLPLIASHRCFEIAMAVPALIIFAAFCLCASSIYLINDLVDLDSDRRHATKRKRPFAAGDVSAPRGALGALFLLAGGLGLAATISLPAVLIAAFYASTSLAYSLYLKKRLALDVFVLAGLYVTRVLAGGLALGIPVSSWLLGFCGFCFLSLALAKRYLELRRASDRGVSSAAGRAYLAVDREIIAMFGIGAALAAGVLLTLYIASDGVRKLYPGAELLWAWAPLLLYWQCRVWTIAHRGHLSDDPVLFAVRDKVTYAVGFAFLGVMYAAATFDVSPLLAVVK